MTRDEAIAVLQEEIDGNLELTLREWKERDEQKLFPALRMAIEALMHDIRTETHGVCSDIIRVELPAEAEFTDLPDIPRYYCERVVGNMAHEINMLKEQLESADRPQGEWIEEKGANWFGGGAWKCSNCEYGYSFGGYHEADEFNYCPNCGAKMKGGTE